MRFSPVALLLVLAATLPADADEFHYATVEGFGGVPLVVAEAGNPQGPAILFVHGYSQSLLSWKYQLGDRALQQRYRLVALDLRGHGASAKPWKAEDYRREALGGDLQAVIEAKGLGRPILVGWSYGGEVAMAFLRHHGVRSVGGLVLVDTATSLEGPAQPPDASDPEVAQLISAVQRMGSMDLASNREGTRRFVDALTARSMPRADAEEALIYNLLTPAYARTAMRYVPDNSDMAGALKLPVLIVHGEQDVVSPPSAGQASHRLIPGSRLLTYRGVGHAPFLEDSRRFNRDLSEFADRVIREEAAAADALRAYFGNTWVYTASDGTKYVYLNSDGSFAIVIQNGSLFHGDWVLKGEEICFHVGRDDASCFDDLLGRTVDVAWEGSRPDKPYRGIIHAGRPNAVNRRPD
jgi:non-heme chloroperoxidase